MSLVLLVPDLLLCGGLSWKVIVYSWAVSRDTNLNVAYCRLVFRAAPFTNKKNGFFFFFFF